MTPPSRMAYIHLAIVYVIWGSTFVAMRAAVADHSGFQPFAVGASRLAVASAILFLIAWLKKIPLKLTRQDFWVSMATGLLIWVCGNGFVMWCEQFVDAGYATLIFSTLPIWTLLMGSFLDRRRPSGILIAASIAAFIGMAILAGRSLLQADTHVLIPTLIILLSTFLWSISTHLQKRKPLTCSLFVASAYQQMFGAAGMAFMMLITQESWPHPTHRAWLAWGYLVIFGSIIAYSSYINVVKNFSPAASMTFAYVCPVLTMIFAYFILDEPITANKVAGMIFILGAVYVIFLNQKKPKPIPN